MKTRTVRRASVTAGAAALLALAGSAHAQFVWQLQPTTFVDLPNVNATHFYNCLTAGDCPGAPGGAANVHPAVHPSGDRSWSAEWICPLPPWADCRYGRNRAYANAGLLTRGNSTAEIMVWWGAVAKAGMYCCENGPGGYYALGTAGVNASVDLLVDGPPGEPVTVQYEWVQLAWTNHRPELAAHEDHTHSTGSFEVTGIPGSFGENAIDVQARLFDRASGTIQTQGGAVINISSLVDVFAELNPPSQPFPPPPTTPYSERDSGQFASWGTQLILRLPGPPPQPTCPEPTLEFTLNIGSDTELSDPTPDGNEKFDPGDVYLAAAVPLPGGPIDGFRNDQVLFGVDPPPTPLAPGGNPAPTCQMAPPQVQAFFDMADVDSLDFSLATLIPPGAPLVAPLARFPSACVHEAQFLVISFDDDSPEHYSWTCSVPTGLVSSISSLIGGGAPYGTSADQDEVVNLWVIPRPLPPHAWVTAPGLSESELHPDLAPNPLKFANWNTSINLPANDDVNGLDMRGLPLPAPCNTLVFTPDHDATLGLSAAVVYQSTGGAPLPVIDATIHLGLPQTVDIRGLEFAWGRAPNLPGEYLMMLFTVAPDDPVVGGFGSGGLDPRMIYGSFLTGSVFAFLDEPLDDSIDAIAAYCAPLLSPPAATCYANCDGSTNEPILNVDDFTCFINEFAAAQPLSHQAQLVHYANCDGSTVAPVLNVADFTCFINAFAQGCP